MAYELVDAPPGGRYELVDHPPIKLGAEALPDTVAAYAGDYHPATQLLAGVGGALGDISTRLGQFWAYGNRGGPDVPTPDLTQQQKTDLEANQALYKASPMAMLGNIGTKLGLTAPAAGPLYGAATNMASKILPSWLQFAAPAAGGAAVGAGVPVVTEPDANLTQGAVGGAVADAATRGAARIIQPITQSPAVQALLQKNIVPTIGSAAGGIAKGIEDKLTSIPFVGDLIKRRQIGAREELNSAQLKLGTPPGENATAIGNEGVSQVKDAFGRAYGKVYDGNEIGMTKRLQQDLDAAKNSTTIPLNDEEVRTFDKIIKRDITDRLATGPVPTNDAKAVIEGALGKAAFEAKGPLQDALKRAKTAFRDAMGQSVGPDGAAELKAIDKAYSNFADVKKAVKQAEGASGVATPRQFQRNAKPGEVKDLANAAQQVLPPSIPNSGTTDRALLNWLLLSGGAMGANQATGSIPGREGPMINPQYLTALAIAPLLYSRGGSRYMMGDLIPGQPALSSAMRQMAPYSAGAGALYAPYQ
jgi:hypothetical protein